MEEFNLYSVSDEYIEYLRAIFPNVYSNKETTFEYEDIKSFSPGISPASYYYFADPLYFADYEELEDGILVAEMPEEMTRKYRGVKRVVCKDALLVDVNYENAYDVIFGAFKILKDK